MTDAQKAAKYDQLVQLLRERIELEKYYVDKNMDVAATDGAIQLVRTDGYKAVVEVILGPQVLWNTQGSR